MTILFWTFESTVKDGQLGKLKDLVGEMAEKAKSSEPGTLRFEWVIGGDGKSAQVHERYADSEAAIAHLASFNANFADRLMELVEPAGMTVYGEPSPELREKLAGANPVYMDVIGGFAR